MVLETTLAKPTDLDSLSYLLNTLMMEKFHIVFCYPRELKFVLFND